MDEQQPIAQAERKDQYQKMLLDMWEVIKTYQSKVRAYYLEIAPYLEAGVDADEIATDKEQQENINTLIALSIGLWEELEPKMKGKEDEANFMAFEDYYHEPVKFILETGKVFELVRTLRNALEVLGITKIEKEVQ